jgi:hypothetical protein
VGDVVVLSWAGELDGGYGFAVVRSLKDSTAVARLVATRTLGSRVIDPLRWQTTITAGEPSVMEIALLNNRGRRAGGRGTRIPQEVKAQLRKVSVSSASKWRAPSWSNWDGKPVVVRHCCD